MTEHIQIDTGKPTCIGVHYDGHLSDATAHFQSAGFHGVTDVTYLERNLDCNDARLRALDAAKRGEGKCFWQGAWDYSAGRCALYKFDFTSYNGPRFKAVKSPDAEAHVDWEEVPAP